MLKYKPRSHGSTHIFIPLLIFFFTLIGTSLACYPGLAPPPTPGPFPVEGVRQISSDFAYYQDLLWSSNNDLIAATRCPVLNFEPRCFENEETVLIYPDTGSIQTIDFQSITSNRVSAYPVIWSPDGAKLLLYLREHFYTENDPSSEVHRRYIEYAPAENTFSEIDIAGNAIAWSKDGLKLLILRNLNEDHLAIGWLSLETREFEEEVHYALFDRFFGPFLLSPDAQTLLKSDSSSTLSCNEVYSYSIGSHKAFEPFLSLACFPAWSPDGSMLVYAAKDRPQSSPSQLMIANADGSDPDPLFPEPISGLSSPTWSPDGTQIAFTRTGLANANAIYIVDVPENLQSQSE